VGADLTVLAVFHGPAAAGRHPRGQPAGGAHPQKPPGRAGPAEPRPPPEPRRRGPYTGSRLGDNFAEDTQVNPLGSPTVIAESAFGKDGVSPQPATAVLDGFQPASRGSRAPPGAGGRPAAPGVSVRTPLRPAARTAPPSPAAGLRLASGPLTPERCGSRGHEAAAPAPAFSGATSAPRPGLFYSFLPVADPPWRELCKLGGSSRHRQPLPGVGTATHVMLSGAARREPGSCSRRDPASARLATEPSPRPPVRGSGPRVAAAVARGLRGRGGSLASFCSEEPTLARGGPPEGHGDTATDTCLQGSAPARARRCEWVRLLAAGWAVAPAPRRPSSSSCSSSCSPASGAPAPRSPPQCPPAGVRGSGRRCAPGGIHCPKSGGSGARCPVPQCVLGGLGSGFFTRTFPAAAAASGRAHSHSHLQTHSCNSGGPEEQRRGEATLPGLPPALSLPSRGTRGRAAGGFY
jgi:hypothetical protein